jgi:hypothetical protein
MKFEPKEHKISASRKREIGLSCPFCGEYCHVASSHERVHFFLITTEGNAVAEELKNEAEDNDQSLLGKNEAEDNHQPRDAGDYMRTSSILRLRTKAKYPWRITNGGGENAPELYATED